MNFKYVPIKDNAAHKTTLVKRKALFWEVNKYKGLYDSN